MWAKKSDFFVVSHTPQMQPVSEVSSTWQRLQSPPPGTMTYEELNGQPQIDRHQPTSVPPDALRSGAMLTLMTSARTWQGVEDDVPGMQPHMVLIADLLDRLNLGSAAQPQAGG